MTGEPQAESLQQVVRPARTAGARNGLPEPGGYTYRGAGSRHDLGYRLAMARLLAIRAIVSERNCDGPAHAGQ